MGDVLGYEDHNASDSTPRSSNIASTRYDSYSVGTTREYCHPRIRQNNGNFIRTRLLSRLGIVHGQVGNAVLEKKTFPLAQNQMVDKNAANHSKTARLDGNAPCRIDGCHLIVEPFGNVSSFDGLTRRYTYRLRDKSSISLKSIDKFGKISQRIHFNDIVNVVEIPSRSSYTSSEFNLLWCNSQEILDMSRRNEKEFYYEKYVWQNAIEENDFVDMGNGLLVHPAHVTPGYMERKRAQQNTIALMNNRNPILEIADRELVSSNVLKVSVGSR